MFRWLANIVQSKHWRETLVRGYVDAVNCGDFPKLGELLTEDFVFTDVAGGSLAGRDVFLGTLQSFQREFGITLVEIDSLDHNRGEVLIRGRLQNANGQIGGIAMWRTVFAERAISGIEVTRTPFRMTLPSFAARLKAKSAANVGTAST